MPRADSGLGRLIRALAARPVPSPPPTSQDGFGRRLVAALAAMPLPADSAAGKRPRFLPGADTDPRPGNGWLPGFITAFAVVLTCLAATAAQGILPMPWRHEPPGREVASEQWRLVDEGRLTPTDAGAEAALFSPAGRRLLLTLSASGLETWELTDPEHPARIAVGSRGMTDPTAMGISSDGGTLVAAGQESISAWRTDTGSLQWLYATPPAGVKALRVGSSDLTLAVSDVAGSTRLQESPLDGTGGLEFTFKGNIPENALRAEFSPDGRTLAIASPDSAVQLWDVASSGEPRRKGRPFGADGHSVTDLSFSADGRLLAVAGGDRRVRLWDIGDPARPRYAGEPLAGVDEPVTAVAFSRDPRLVATVGTDRTAALWWRD